MVLSRLVFSWHSPFSAEMVVDAIARMSDQIRISRATIYRTLQHMVESQSIAVVSESDDLVLYAACPSPGNPMSALCRNFHARLIAGTCPWCGRSITDGKAR